MADGYRIKHSNGTYFRCWTQIGPAFGATRDNAETFATAADAAAAMGHWAFASCEVESPTKTRSKKARAR